MSKSLGRRIRRARLQSSWSQRDLAEKIKIAQSTVSYWEQGEKSPDERQLKQLEKYLGSLSGTAGKGIQARETSTDGPSPFGTWLSKSRQDQEYSVAELSELSDVSIPAIYAIEAGKIENPRQETIRKLEKALKRTHPKSS